LVFSFVAAAAQQASVVSKIDSVSILIGQQAHLTVEVTARKGANVTFPRFKRAQQMVPGVEVVETSPENRSESDDQLTVSKTFTLTSFDGKLYAIPGMKVKVDGKVYASNQLALKVLECEVDTLHPEKFFPPKDVQDNPFMWSEWSPLYWLGVLVMLVSAFLGEGVLRLLLVAHEVGLRCTLFGEAPLVVGRVRTDILRVGVEHHRERSRTRIARARLFAFVGCECGLWVDGRHFVGVSL